MDEKEKRRKRLNNNKRIIKNRLKFLREMESFIPDRTGKTYFQSMSDQPNRLNKKHPYDCGNSKCYLCHSEKLFGNKKLDEKKLP